MRLIDADAMKFECVRRNNTIALEIIDDIPTVDAARIVHGEWIKKPYLLGTTRYCSRCGENYGMPHGVFNFCPNCGAKMEGGN